MGNTARVLTKLRPSARLRLRRRGIAFATAAVCCIVCCINSAMGQPPPVMSSSTASEPLWTNEARSREKTLIAEVREPELRLEVDPRTSKIIRTTKPIARISVTAPGILEATQLGPAELELIGLLPGETALTLWFADPDGRPGREMLRYLVRVSTDEAAEERRRIEYRALERRIQELFPDSYVRLFSVGDKLIVRGQARDSREAGEILQLIADEFGDVDGDATGRGRDGYGYGPFGYGGYAGYGYGGYGGYGGFGYGYGGQGYGYGYGGGPWGRGGNRGWGGGWGAGYVAPNIINMLDVPGEKQVLLKVRVAEISRSALREIGSRLNMNFGDFSFGTNLGINGAFSAVLSTQDLRLTLEALSTNAYSKVLAEPNLVTLSGHSAYFIAGGEFAVPTVVGVEGVSAVTRNFRSFGTQLRFTPTVLDKDRIRLEVQPSFSNLDNENTVEGVPGLQTRAVETTVDLREGQWLAIAGLIQDQQEGSKSRVPYLGDVPFLDLLFSKRRVKRDETELLVLVSPELVHPLEPEEAPLILPGMEVTEPDDCAFFFAGDYEGRGDCQHRSTVWPIVQRGHLQSRQEFKRQPAYQASEQRYIQGPHGFSE